MLRSRPSPRTIVCRVFSRDQKEALYSLDHWPDYIRVVGKTDSSIDYQMRFAYYTNFRGWMTEYKALFPQYKFKILHIYNY